MYVGFDMEWDFSTGQSGGSKATALLQIALTNTVYLMRMCAVKKIPNALRVILTSTRIVKIGHNIGSDLQKLARDFPEFKLPSKKRNLFEGTVELGHLAKAKNIVSKATASLSAITAAALHYYLSKETRASEWSSPQLSNEQI
jgi:ribonuclease D